MPLRNTWKKQKVQREITEMALWFCRFPFDFDLVTDHGENQVGEPQGNDHPVDRIDPVKPIDKNKC